jgi:nucleoside-diphosphate-sugar epimerase
VNPPPPPADEALHVVLGAGPVGRAVVDELRQQGRRVRLVTRSGKSTPVGVESVLGDALEADSLSRACAGATTIYHCASPAYHRWPELFPRLQANVIAVAKESQALVVAAENLYGYGVAGDLRQDLPMLANTRKGRVRAEVSQSLFAAHGRGELRAVAGRASDFFGPGVTNSVMGERFWLGLLAGKSVSWFGDADVPHTFTYVPDFARALIMLADCEAAYGRAWHVTCPPAMSPRALVAKASALAGLPPARVKPLPEFILRVVGLFIPAAGETVELRYLFDQELRVNAEPFLSLTGQQATDWEVALRQTVVWWRNRANS